MSPLSTSECCSKDSEARAIYPGGVKQSFEDSDSLATMDGSLQPRNGTFSPPSCVVDAQQTVTVPR